MKNRESPLLEKTASGCLQFNHVGTEMASVERRKRLELWFSLILCCLTIDPLSFP